VPGASLASRASRPAILEDRRPAPLANLEGLLLVLPGPRGLLVLPGRQAPRELFPELFPQRPWPPQPPTRRPRVPRPSGRWRRCLECPVVASVVASVAPLAGGAAPRSAAGSPPPRRCAGVLSPVGRPLVPKVNSGLVGGAVVAAGASGRASSLVPERSVSVTVTVAILSASSSGRSGSRAVIRRSLAASSLSLSASRASWATRDSVCASVRSTRVLSSLVDSAAAPRRRRSTGPLCGRFPGPDAIHGDAAAAPAASS
jgi:hypothetical protein